jgi:hypothetical protein
MSEPNGGQEELTAVPGFDPDETFLEMRRRPLALTRKGELVEYDGTTETRGSATYYRVRVVDHSPRIGERFDTLQSPEGLYRD